MKNIIILLVMLGFGEFVFAQRIGVGTTTPQASAILDITSTSRGLLIPRMTTGQRNAIVSPAIGLQILNMDDKCIDIYDGANWIKNCGLKVIGSDTLTSQWVQRASFGGAARSGAVSFAIGNLGYVGTGLVGTNYTKDFWAYDPVSNTWMQKADLAGAARAMAAAFALSNKGYVGTGYIQGGRVKDFWQYDPVTNSWTQKPDFPGTARGAAVGFGAGLCGFITTGNDDTGSKSDTWQYCPGGNMWFPIADLPGGGRHGAVSFVLNGIQAFVGGGNNGRIDFWELIGPDWIPRSNIPVGCESGVGLSLQTVGIVGAGANNNNTQNFWLYNLSSGSWSAIDGLGSGNRYAPTGFAIGTKAYVGTGMIGATQMADFYEYSLHTIKPKYQSVLDADSTYSIHDGIWTKEGIDVFVNQQNVGIGLLNTENKLDISNNNRTGIHPTNRPLYVTGDIQADTSGIEFRQSNGSQGIGFGYNTIYAAGNFAWQDLGFKAKGSGRIKFITNGVERLSLYSNGMLQLANNYDVNNRKIVLWEELPNDHQFYGLGINADAFRYQVSGTTSSHIFYAGTSSNTSNELMRIHGNGYVGIGNSTPHAPLQFATDVAQRKIVLYDELNNDHQFYGFGVNAGVLRYQVSSSGANHVFYAGTSSASSTELMRITGTGNIGIGNNNPGQKLVVSGNGVFTGTVTASCGVLSCSDMRYKTNVQPLSHSLQMVMALNGMYYHWDNEKFPEKNFNDERQVGVAAQELEKVLPELVHTDADGYKTVDYSRLTPVLIEAIKEQQLMIEYLKKEQEAIQSSYDTKISSLIDKLIILEASVNELKAGK